MDGRESAEAGNQLEQQPRARVSCDFMDVVTAFDWIIRRALTAVHDARAEVPAHSRPTYQRTPFDVLQSQHASHGRSARPAVYRRGLPRLPRRRTLARAWLVDSGTRARSAGASRRHLFRANHLVPAIHRGLLPPRASHPRAVG